MAGSVLTSRITAARFRQFQVRMKLCKDSHPSYRKPLGIFVFSTFVHYRVTMFGIDIIVKAPASMKVTLFTCVLIGCSPVDVAYAGKSEVVLEISANVISACRIGPPQQAAGPDKSDRFKGPPDFVDPKCSHGAVYQVMLNGEVLPDSNVWQSEIGSQGQIQQITIEF